MWRLIMADKRGWSVREVVGVISTVVMLALVVYLFPINENVKKIESESLIQHDQIMTLEKDIEVNKAVHDGELKLIKTEVQNANKKLDSIIKAINNNGGLLICDPIETPKKGATN